MFCVIDRIASRKTFLYYFQYLISFSSSYYLFHISPLCNQIFQASRILSTFCLLSLFPIYLLFDFIVFYSVQTKKDKKKINCKYEFYSDVVGFWRKILETKIKWRKDDEFISTEKKSDTGSQKNITHFIIIATTSLLTAVKNNENVRWCFKFTQGKIYVLTNRVPRPIVY